MWLEVESALELQTVASPTCDGRSNMGLFLFIVMQMRTAQVISSTMVHYVESFVRNRNLENPSVMLVAIAYSCHHMAQKSSDPWQSHTANMTPSCLHYMFWQQPKMKI